MSIVANVLKKLENKQLNEAEKQAGKLTSKSMASASFIVRASGILKPITEKLLKRAAEDLQVEGYVAQYSYSEFSSHIAASLALCPKHGDVPKDIHGLECAMGQAFNSGYFLIRVEADLKCSVTGVCNGRTHECCVKFTTNLVDLDEDTIARLLETYLDTVLSPKEQTYGS